MSLFLRGHERRKDGKTNTYWSLVENRRCAGGRVVQRHVLYLGRLTPAQEASWQKTAEQFGEGTPPGPTLPGLATERELQSKEAAAIAVHLKEFRIERPRQWGSCWVGLRAWNLVKLREFWSCRLPPSREGTRWLNVLIALVIYRLVDPGSEWRLHRQWYSQSALGDLLGEDFGLAAKDNLYRCLDRLLEHREELFKYLRGRWQDEFGAKFDVLLYDLTSTYFESDPPFPEGDKRRFGYSRDKRPDCVHTRDQLLMAVGQTKEQAGRAFKLLDIQWPQEGQALNAQTFTFRLALDRYRLWYRREGRYLLRTNLTQTDPKQLWEYYLQLVAIEAAFRNLKEDLEIRPIFHQKEERIEAHIFVAYLAYCLHVTLQAKLRQVAGGLTPRSLLEKFATMQMMDVFFPTEERGKELVFRRYTQPEKDHQVLLAQLGWELPEQPPPRISIKGRLLD